MTIDVDRVARLSKLEIPNEKKTAFEKQMNEIAQMAQVLALVGDEPDSECEDFAQLRQDAAYETQLTHEDVMANAPCTKDGYLCVPRAVEQ